mmetsp:Transcript_118380/g.339809  ORF Transcript_118380/g.339809 Transcript_118380/m.339809 type:complete len:506 (+) Transcript_118380:57-1574(+)
MGSSDVIAACGGFCALCILVLIITTLASCKSPERDEQLVIHYLDGKEVVNGPTTKVVNPFRELERRKQIRLQANQYVIVRDQLTGAARLETGFKAFFLGAYEEADEIRQMMVLAQNQWVRMVDQLSGAERIVVGPTTVVPGAWELQIGDIESAAFVNTETAVVVRHKVEGTLRLHTTAGVFIPAPYEEIVDTRNRISVLPNEVMVVRTLNGALRFYVGSTTFFQQPWEEILAFKWSVFSEPFEGQRQVITRSSVTRIDTRIRRVFYQYDVRTVDNVPLAVEGSIFWRIADIEKLIRTTGDPPGDVWYRARSVLITSVSKVDFMTFMKTFNTLIKTSFLGTAGDDFWSERGIELRDMEVTRYECTDPEIAETLQAINAETTNRINQLEAQRSENDVLLARLLADIELEQDRTSLLASQSKNSLLTAKLDGEAQGVQLAEAASSFLDGLNVSLPDVKLRLRLYKLQRELETKGARTDALADSDATLFFTTESLGLKLSYEDHFQDEL